MADLSIGSGAGTQSTTQSPQSLVSGGASTSSGSSVQPGTTNTLLTSPSGIALQNTQLSTVSLGTSEPAVASTAAAAIASTPQKHHLNAGLMGASVSLLVIALVLFWAISRSSKNTTDYY